MKSSAKDSTESLDERSSRSICEAVGKRLQQTLSQEMVVPSSQLQHLVDELRKRDEAGGQTGSN